MTMLDKIQRAVFKSKYYKEFFKGKVQIWRINHVLCKEYDSYESYCLEIEHDRFPGMVLIFGKSDYVKGTNYSVKKFLEAILLDACA